MKLMIIQKSFSVATWSFLQNKALNRDHLNELKEIFYLRLLSSLPY